MDNCERDLEALRLADPPEYLKDRIMINARYALARRQRSRKRIRTVMLAVAASLLIVALSYCLYIYTSPDDSDHHLFRAGQAGASRPHALVASTDSTLTAPHAMED